MAPTSRDVAKAAASKKKKKTDDPYRPNWGNDLEWAEKPYFRGGPRPPRISPPRDSTTSSDSAGNSRQFFNPKAKLDASGVKDKRSTNPNRTVEPPLTEWETYHPRRTKGPNAPKPKNKYDPNFKWPNAGKYRPGPPPKSRVDTDDITSTMAPRRTAMENLIAQANQRRRYQAHLMQGHLGTGQ